MSKPRCPRRLLEAGGEPNALLDEALRAGAVELPGEEVLEQIWGRLPVGPAGGPDGGSAPPDGGGPTEGGGPPADGGGPAPPAGPGAGPGWLPAGGTTLKLAAGAVVAAAAVGVALHRTPSPALAPTASMAAPSAAASYPVVTRSTSPAAASSAGGAAGAPPMPAEPLVAPSAHAPSSAHAPTAMTSASADAGTQPSELALLRRARAALGTQPAQALTLVAEATRRYPHGALGQEREVIRIQALDGVGRHSEALGAARTFLGRHPRSAYAPRLRSLFGELGESGAE